MPRFSIKSLLVATAVIALRLLLPGVSARADNDADRKDDSIRHPSPLAVFDAYREAQSKDDYRTVFHCLTPGAKSDAIFKIYRACQTGTSKRMPAVGAILKQYGLDTTVISADYFKSYQAKHGIDARLLDERYQQQVARRNFADGVPPPPPDDDDLLREIVNKRIIDSAAFYVDVRKASRPSDAPAILIGELTKIHVDGDTAVGYAIAPSIRSTHSSRSKAPRWQVKYVHRKYRFRQIQNGWFIETAGEQQ